MFSFALQRAAVQKSPQKHPKHRPSQHRGRTLHPHTKANFHRRREGRAGRRSLRRLSQHPQGGGEHRCAEFGGCAHAGTAGNGPKRQAGRGCTREGEQGKRAPSARSTALTHCTRHTHTHQQNAVDEVQKAIGFRARHGYRDNSDTKGIVGTFLRNCVKLKIWCGWRVLPLSGGDSGNKAEQRWTQCTALWRP